MYKKFTLEQLGSLKTGFFTNFKNIFERRRYPTLKSFLKDITKEGNTIYFFSRSYPAFRIIKNNDEEYTFIDEKEKIELHAGPTTVTKLHNMLKSQSSIKRHTKGSKTMKQILWHDFKEDQKFTSLNGKPYLVYDIETTYATNNLKDIKFYMAYAFIVDENGVGKYSFIGPENLDKFVQYMVDFNGYIVGFNSIAFDNPVSVYNTENGTDEMIDIINKKSIDLFLFLRNLTGKRMGLNRTAQALVGITKTLESGAEGDKLMKLYEETGDEKYYKEFKKYCKNDVEMTVLVMFYLMKNKKVYIDNTEYTFGKDEFLQRSSKKRSSGKKTEKKKQRSMF